MRYVEKNLKIIIFIIISITVVNFSFSQAKIEMNKFNPQPIVGDWFYIQGVDPTEPLEINYLNESGIRGIRLGFDWVNTESGFKGNYNWTYSDASVSILIAKNLKCIGLISYGNGLYNSPGNGEYCRSFDMSTEEEMDGYVDFVKELLYRYQEKGIIWEIQNEPDLFLYNNDPNCGRESFNNQISDTNKGILYATLLKKVADQVRPLYPNEIIITGGLAFGGSEMSNAFIDKAARDRSLNAFDAFSFHEYQINIEKYNNETQTSNSTWKRNQLNERLKNNGYNNTVFINTESGGSGADNFEADLYDNIWDGFDPDGSLSDMQQAAYIPRTYLYGLSNSSSLYVNHVFNDIKREEFQEVDNPRERFFGIIDTLGNKKPSFFAIKTMIDQLNGYKLIENKSEGNTMDKENYRMLNSHLVFQKNNDIEHVIWGVQDGSNNYSNTRNARFYLPNGNYIITNMLGNLSSNLNVTQGYADIQVNEYPLYLKSGTNIKLANAENKIIYYSPNPFINSTTLYLSEGKKVLEVTNILGKNIQKITTSDLTYSLGERWKSGVYFVKINGQTIKFIKQ